ncbi:tyrosine-type recombinase/integrase [Rufibacter ruber]|uniref:tyrosine-type recombinase/integrase n=1 Tax=Rufibacter ruber TaxID=1783499 RepID=UPI00082D511D|nr:tyrosine-type recombinase/integrase [Rufibacter ruber]
MIAKSIIYKGSVYIYASRNREHIRIPAGIKCDKLNANGLLNKSSGLSKIEDKNTQIRDLLKKVQAALDGYPNLSAKEIITYIKTGALPNVVVEEVRQLSFLECFEKFIEDSKTGKRLTDKGTVFEKNTIKSYQSVLTNLKKFKEIYPLEWDNINDNFYNRFCEYYWENLNSFDNNVGKAVKIVKTMLNYAFDTGMIKVQLNVKKWKSWKEEIQILVLYHDEIKLLYSMPINNEKLLRTRDIFLMGVFTCLRVENLLNLTENDLQVIQNEFYINTLVTKTKKHIRIKMNSIGADIITKYRSQFKTLLPEISSQNFNANLKELAAIFIQYLNELKEKNQMSKDMIGNSWDKDFKRIRTRKGVVHYEYISPAKYISSHCMRRSGITNLLMLGMTPFEVQAISGHSLNSRDFAKYVKLSSQVVEKKSVDAWTNVLSV